MTPVASTLDHSDQSNTAPQVHAPPPLRYMLKMPFNAIQKQEYLMSFVVSHSLLSYISRKGDMSLEATARQY